MSNENFLNALSGGAFPGIGQATAAKVIRLFGDRLSDVLDRADISALLELLTEKKARALLRGWVLHREKLTVAQWLDEHGVGAEVGALAWKVWGQASVEKLSSNPYRLLAFCSWSKVDGLAARLGVAVDSPVRLVAAVEQAAYEALDSGGTCCTRNALAESVAELLSKGKAVPGDFFTLALAAIDLAVETGAIIFWEEGYQVPGAFFSERDIEAWLLRRQLANATTVTDVTRWVTAFQEGQGVILSDEQIVVIKNALDAPVSVFFGGAGVGKTFTVKAVCDAAEALIGKPPVLLALAAKAVRRLTEATGREATTLARCLHRMQTSSLEGRMVIIDEASMVDLLTFRNLVRKLPDTSNLVLLGDPGQLPPIGAGNVLHDFLRSGVVPLQELTQVHRQKAESGLPAFLGKVRRGEWPELPPFDWLDPLRLGLSILRVSEHQVHRVCERLMTVLGDDTQFISPQVQGRNGTRSLNTILQRAVLNQDEWVVGTQVIFTKNERLSSGDEVVNGQMGRIQQWCARRPRSEFAPWLRVSTDQGLVTVTLGEAKHGLELAWAISVHKAQGSDWETVVAVLPPHQILLDRSMVYTALSRCKSRCICVVPDVAAVKTAVEQSPSHERRRTGLFRYAGVAAGIPSL